MSKEKVCPIMAQGWISGFMSNSYNESIMTVEGAIKKLPKCLKEDCRLWVGHRVEDGLMIKLNPGHCGLIN